MTHRVCLVEDAREWAVATEMIAGRFAREVRITQTFGRHSGLPRTIAGGMRAGASQQSWALIPPGPYPLPEFRHPRPHEER